jgi:superfamily II DNA or RNA helicase
MSAIAAAMVRRQKRMAETPYVCLRLPTGGGKTFLAARAVKVAASLSRSTMSTS